MSTEHVFRVFSVQIRVLDNVVTSTVFNHVIAIMLVVKLFIYFFSLLNRKLNKDSKNALKTVIFLLQVIL